MAGLRQRVRAGAILARGTVLHLERPDRFPRAALAMAPWGTSLTGLVAGAAARYPDAAAIIDDEGCTTYRELWARVNSIAAKLSDRGVAAGTGVGILCRNHRGFVETLAAVAATGADITLLNTGFAGPQLADVVEHEGISVLIHDDDFTTIAKSCGAEHIFDEATIGSFAQTGRTVPPNKQPGRIVILTSGTTGRPKGAARSTDPAAIEAVAAIFERIPLKIRDTQVIAAPLFHAWGLSHLLLGLSRCATNVLSRRFVASSTLSSMADHDANVLVVVPVMLARMIAIPNGERPATPRLRVIASSGSSIGSKLVTDVLEGFGPVLYNLYGSTEIAAATIATPDDLASDPATAGRVAFGVTVEILDDDGEPLANGETGRIFVGSGARFEGYTDGATKPEYRGLLSSGDVGYFRDELLFVSGREDDMIVSGGENVFPIEVEELLSHHPAIDEVAVVGIPDDKFGQALAAFVVLSGDATADEIRRHVKNNLARHKVPRQVHLVDELPRNATGKLLRKQMINTATGG